MRLLTALLLTDAIDKGGPGSGPHPGYTKDATRADAKSNKANALISHTSTNSQDFQHMKYKELVQASRAHQAAAVAHRSAMSKAPTEQLRQTHAAAREAHMEHNGNLAYEIQERRSRGPHGGF